MIRWVKIMNEWYELLEIGTRFVSVLIDFQVILIPKIFVNGYKLDWHRWEV